eukprot:comp5424_c0_seq1/m.4650 comp5424_c0_seq1/g.4650  ORF comp5424_c0_seq1/g.4650 comp5424_c0_seq1/m.4650 type:complete len:131 (-) comp5424_c0_seq1:33-425(-)
MNASISLYRRMLRSLRSIPIGTRAKLHYNIREMFLLYSHSTDEKLIAEKIKAGHEFARAIELLGQWDDETKSKVFTFAPMRLLKKTDLGGIPVALDAGTRPKSHSDNMFFKHNDTAEERYTDDPDDRWAR